METWWQDVRYGARAEEGDNNGASGSSSALSLRHQGLSE